MVQVKKNGLRIDRPRMDVWVNGKRIGQMPPKEFEVLAELYDARGEVCTAEALVTAAKVNTDDLAGPAIGQYVMRIRRRLGKDARKMIETVTGRGYKLPLHHHEN